LLDKSVEPVLFFFINTLNMYQTETCCLLWPVAVSAGILFSNEGVRMI